MKQFAEIFYKSTTWQNCREAVMRQAQGLCQDCLKEGKVVPAKEVHHIIPITARNIHDPRITLNGENLVALCRECHRKRHGARQRRYEVDEYGRVKAK